MAKDWWHTLPRYMKVADVARMFGLSNKGIVSMVKNGHLPAPIRLGYNIVRYDKYKLMLMVLSGMSVNDVESMTEMEMEARIKMILRDG